jgi:hypothetical protein
MTLRAPDEPAQYGSHHEGCTGKSEHHQRESATRGNIEENKPDCNAKRHETPEADI